ncbi:INT5 protein, partial [Turnix velox]|nr:INT5 protein [Turnix velox]
TPLGSTPPPSLVSTTLQEGVREGCDRLLQLLLLHLQKLLFQRPQPNLDPSSPSSSSSCPPPKPVPFLEGLKPHLQELCLEVLRLERKRFLWQHQILALLALYWTPQGGAEALASLLTLARGQEELALATQLHATLSPSLPDLLPPTLATCLQQIHAGRLPPPQIAQICRNFALVL